MVYKIIPSASDIPSQSQAQILENFNQLNVQFGTEHSSLTGAADGKHKYVTLIRAPGAPAVAGNDWQMTHEFSNNTNFLRVQNSAAVDQFIPVIRSLSAVPIIVGDTKIIDLSTLGDHLVGTVLVIDHNQRDRTIFSPFNRIAPNTDLPGATGQLVSSFADFEKLVSDEPWISIRSNIVTTVDVILTYTFY